MPAQHRLRLHQQDRPGRSRQPLPERAQDQAIWGLPAGPLDLPLQHLHLLPEPQYLRLQGRLVPPVELDQVQDQSEGGIDGREEHGPAPEGSRFRSAAACRAGSGLNSTSYLHCTRESGNDQMGSGNGRDLGGDAIGEGTGCRPRAYGKLDSVVFCATLISSICEETWSF